MPLANIKIWHSFHDISKCDQTWMTYCALHNYLFEKDGLAESWEKGQSPDQDGFESISMPFALRKLLDIDLAQRYDTSGNGIGNDVDIDFDDAPSIVHNPQIQNDDLSYNINDMSLNQFREKLIRHFNILFTH